MSRFAQDIQNFANKTEHKLDLLIRKIALEMFSRIVLRSPVDEGRFRGNWQVAIGSIPQGTLELNDLTGIATINKIEATTLQVEAGDVIVLVNNLPYGPRLENGYSKKAPAGMVGVTVQEFQDIARQVGLEIVRL